MPSPPRTPWARRLRRLAYLFGAGTTLYLVSAYALDRMREARVRALRERRERDLIKSHFTSLLSTISFTLYALLPTLAPQLAAAYPVEATSQALQGMKSGSGSTSMSSSQASVAPAVRVPVLGAQDAQHEASGSAAGGGAAPGEGSGSGSGSGPGPPAEGGRGSSEAGTSGNGSAGPGGHLSESQQAESSSTSPTRSSAAGVEDSWASEFQRRTSETTDELVSAPSEADDVSAQVSAHSQMSTLSQTISLPPTDLSSTSGSSPSDLSLSAQLHPSPPRIRSDPAATGNDVHLSVPTPETRSKKELWRDLKEQSITRALTTAYVLPLLHLLTASQLSTLARLRYLQDVRSALPPPPSVPVPTIPSSSRASLSSSKRSWLGSFSIDAMGLSEFVDETTSLLPDPLSILPTAVTRFLPAWAVRSAPGPSTLQYEAQADMQAAMLAEQAETELAEAERMYLSYSWWLLNEGWKGVAKRVEDGVERVFGGMPLKRELSIEDWDGLIREARAGFETEDGTTLYDFSPNLLPPTLLPHITQTCPLPIAPSSPHLASLLSQTSLHLASPDARYLLNKGVDAMIRKLLESLKTGLYDQSQAGGSQLPSGDADASGADLEGRRRLVDCLPEINRWVKGVWEGVPDGGVEALLALPEFETFSALIFGDWAPR